MGSFWSWATSGWGDAKAQWADPITSIENSLLSTAGLPTTPVAGSTTWSAGNSTGDAAPDPGTTPWSDAEPWVIAGGAMVGLLLVVVLIHELEGL